MSKYYLYFNGYERVLPEFSQPIFLLNKKIKFLKFMQEIWILTKNHFYTWTK